MEGEKAAIQKRQDDLLNERYDLSDKPASGAKMFRGKAGARRCASEIGVRRNVGIARQHDGRRNQIEKGVSQRLLAAAACQSSGRRA